MTDLDIERARECYQRRDWGDAYRLFSLRDRSVPLAPDDLERLAQSAYLIGQDLDFERYLERAHHARVADADHARAARAAFWLGLTSLFRGQPALASGWLARAERLILGQDCVEQGYLLLPAAEQQLEQRESKAAFSTAGRAADIGDRFGEPDLVACAQHLQGRALIQQGQVRPGLQLLDEAMISVRAGSLSPIMTGLVYCSVIDACQRIFALSRAREWTFALADWCERQPTMQAFKGTCLVHRALVLQLRGWWTDAMSEACLACERIAERGTGKPPAAALYRRGEIHRLRGELEAAEAEYRAASLTGFEPQPGLALLRAAQGRIEVAVAAIRRVLEGVADPLDRANLLPARVDIELAAGNKGDARAASSELDEIARRYPTEVTRAMAAQASGAVALADGNPRLALSALRTAFSLWHEVEAPYEIARVRLSTALACRALGDTESAGLEFDAARALFEQLGAKPDVVRLNSLRSSDSEVHRPRLTARELDVLRQIAAGKTNKAIGAELSVSERTIDRHVSNILTKLGVPSRAAAIAHAYSNELL
jgi:DNA-binding NarL/FixJ family response regulator